jgi:exosortase/archaeosortase family protein
MISQARRQLRVITTRRSLLWVVGLIGAAQSLLCWRADVLVLAIPSGLAWIFALTLLDDWLKQQPPDWRPPVLALQLLGAAMVLWCLNVLSFASQFYDPLQQFLPLMTLNGVALLLWGSRRPQLNALLSAYAVMVPLQVWGVPHLPTGFYDWMGMMTARGAGLLLAMVGQLGATDGNYIMLKQRTLAVAGTCTGLTVMALCLTTVFCFQWSFRLFSWRRLLAVLLASSLVCGVINSLRVAIIATTSRQCDNVARLFYCQLDFWHDGIGSLVFSMLSLWGTCWLVTTAHGLELPTRRRLLARLRR